MSRRYWYAYTGPLGGENTPGNYILTSANPEVFCPGGPDLCAIYTFGTTVPYSISPVLQSYITLAKSRKHAYPDSSGRKPYVYVKGNL